MEKPSNEALPRLATVGPFPNAYAYIGAHIVIPSITSKQLAFVLNLQQHWFTLRRFGPASPNYETDEGEGFWFNLNSQYPAPKWVSRTYLGMFLQQSEEEGKLCSYVFTIASVVNA